MQDPYVMTGGWQGTEEAVVETENGESNEGGGQRPEDSDDIEVFRTIYGKSMSDGRSIAVRTTMNSYLGKGLT
jgi:hypothetical protein